MLINCGSDPKLGNQVGERAIENLKPATDNSEM